MFKHGKKGTRLYRIWLQMKNRCYNAKTSRYPDYGGRGIRVCDEWLHDFQAFWDWSMSHGYADDLSIDRINNNGDYSPDNCRWVSPLVQANNSRHCRVLTFNGESHSISEWSRITGIPRHTISNRVNSYGWTVDKALTVANGAGKRGRHEKDYQ